MTYRLRKLGGVWTAIVLAMPIGGGCCHTQEQSCDCCQSCCNPCTVNPTFFGHHATCWHAWPEEWMQCPPPATAGSGLTPIAASENLPPTPPQMEPLPPVSPDVPGAAAPKAAPPAAAPPNEANPFDSDPSKAEGEDEAESRRPGRQRSARDLRSQIKSAAKPPARSARPRAAGLKKNEPTAAARPLKQQPGSTALRLLTYKTPIEPTYPGVKVSDGD